jgi:hypothetical protein
MQYDVVVSETYRSLLCTHKSIIYTQQFSRTMNDLCGGRSVWLAPIIAMVSVAKCTHVPYFSYHTEYTIMQTLSHTHLSIISSNLRRLHVMLGSHSPFSIHVADSDPANSNPGGQSNIIEVPSNAGLL